MTKKNNQNFFDKVFMTLILLFFLRVIYMIFTFNKYDSIIDFILSIIGNALLFFVLIIILAFFSDEEENTSSSRNGSNFVVGETLFEKLQRRYREMAQKYEQEGNYKKAAHIYIKLLKDYYEAGKVLEDGKLYNEAAFIYIKYLNNKDKAAKCYENAKDYKKAINIHKELNNLEKVGDLYTIINQPKEAKEHYLKLANQHNENEQYVKSSLLYRNKIKDPEKAQSMLLTGWRSNKDSFNCLNNYFQNITDIEQLKTEIQHIYTAETNHQNILNFLEVLKYEYKKDEKLQETTKNIAYEIVANSIEENKEISSELKYFNTNNKTISNDIFTFRNKK